MYRFVAVGFSLLVIVLTTMGLASPHGHLAIVMDTSPLVSAIRIALALLLLVYSVSPYFRYELPRKLVLGSGLGVLWFLFVSLITDTAPFPEPVDVFFGVEGSVVALVAALDFERPKTVQKLMPHITLPELLLARLRKIHVAVPTSTSRRKAA